MKKKMISIGCVLTICVLMIVPAVPAIARNTGDKSSLLTVNGKTLYVGGSGPGNYSHIQDAVNDAVNGDIVFVYHTSSPYYENIIIRTSIHLLGENRTTTIIDAHHQGYAIIISANNVSCSGFTIRNSTLEGIAVAGILLNSTYNLITDNILTKNDNALWISTSCCQFSWANTIQRNRFLDNDNDGITIYHSYDNTIDDNEFIDNADAISITESTNTTIYNNRFHTNEIGVYLYDSSIAIITNNSFTGDGVIIFGDALEYWNTHTIQNNTINNAPLCYIKNINNPVIPSDAGMILLANCTHCLIQNRTITQTHHGIQLGFCYENLIIGTTVQQTVFGIYLTHSSNNRIEQCRFLNNFNGLDLWAYCTNTIITNCTFSGNQYEGLSCMYETMDILIANCTAYDNLFGINTFDSSEITIVNCTVFRNDIGIEVMGQGNVIAGCIATGNRIGFMTRGDNNIVTACSAIGNHDYGVYFYAATASQITQCLLAENNKSGAFLMASTGNRITHCICSNNGIEGGINFYGSTGNVVSLNNLTGNAVGINPSHSNNNNISSNNFIGNTRDVVFKAISKANTKQHWQGNYWEVPRRFPKLIIGTFFIAGIIKIPFINVDWHPAQAPYNIT